MSIEVIFEDMNYGSEFESDKEAKEWIDVHEGTLGAFISGNWALQSSDQATDILNISNNEKLATVKHRSGNLLEAVQSASNAHEQWLKIPIITKTQFMNNLSKCLQRKSSLLAKLESISTGRLVKQVQSVVVPQAINHFQYFSGWTGFLDKKKSLKPLGVIIVCLPANSSLLTAIQKVAPAIATHNSVVLYLDASHNDNTVNLAHFCFAELVHHSCFPSGIFNVIYASKALQLDDVLCPYVGGVTYVGALERGRKLYREAITSAVKLTQFFEYKFVISVFENADINSAVDAVVQMIQLSSEHAPRPRIVVQESVYTKFFKLLRTRLDGLRFGSSMNLIVDIGPLVRSLVQELTEKLRLINANDVVQVCLPRLDILTFRTVKEAVELINDSLSDVRASIWTENVTLAMEVLEKVQASVIWINSFNEYDASVELSNRKLSGGGHDGGKRCLYSYIQPAWCETVEQHTDVHNDGHQCSSFNVEYVKKALDSARKSQLGWHNAQCLGRSKILLNALDALLKEKHTLIKQFESAFENAVEVVDNIAQHLYWFACHCAKNRSVLPEPDFKGRILNICEPLGVVVLILPNDCSLVICAYLVFSIISSGNAVLICYEGKASKVLSLVIQKLVGGGLPNGIINLIPVNPDAILSCICHQYVDAVWYFGSKAELSTVAKCAAEECNLQLRWSTYLGHIKSDQVPLLDPGQFHYNSTQNKVVWFPSGVTFAN